jgi:hypothetical protein
MDKWRIYMIPTKDTVFVEEDRPHGISELVKYLLVEGTIDRSDYICPGLHVVTTADTEIRDISV